VSGSLQSTIRDLQLRRGRERRGLALAEGVRLVEEALAAGVPIRGAAVSPALEGTPRGKALKAALAGKGARLEEVGDPELDQLADTEHPQGIVAVIEPRRWALHHIDLHGGGTVLVMDGVQDPGNVGTMLRTAHALGAAGVVALKGTAELTNPKVIRGSMGALFRFPCVPTDETAFLEWSRASRLTIWVAAADGEHFPDRPDRPDHPDRPDRLALVLGNEGAGVRPVLSSAASRRIAIRLAPGAESLNVAAAAAILLHEVLRDR
jgi:TrmH family RNA methyltransferase